jgi:predicted ATPase/DNA-binding CsgD family transcriptional regulator
VTIGEEGAIPPDLRLGRGPLVGRARELAVLARALAEARAGRAAVVLLAGEPGIGKSRLLDEFPPPSLAAGVTVLRGGASQAEGMPPYLPFLEALGEYVAAAPLASLRDDAGAGAAALATLLPELPARLGPLPPRYPLAPEQARLRLFEAVAAFLGAIAARGALALVLDDLQWADAATCDLLLHLTRRLAAAPLLVVGAYREGEADDNAAFARAVIELNRQRLLTPLPVRPLSGAESHLLAASLLGGEPAPALRDLLHRHGDGNPFFEEEVLRALVEAGTVVRRAGRWELGSSPGTLLPAGLAGAIRQRLARLAPEVVELLRVAAIAGRTSPIDVLAAVARRPADEVEALLQAAVRARLLRPDADGGYTFVHDKVRETLAADLPALRRRRLHQAIGEALEARAAAVTPATLADLAFHFGAAVDAVRGVAYALQAGEAALRAYAPAEAMRHFAVAADLVTGAPDDDRRMRALFGLGDAATLAGEHRRAESSYEAARLAALRRGDPALTAHAWRRLGASRRRREAIAEARAAFERALELLGPADSAAAAETLLELADLLAVSLGRRDDGLAYGERALAMVERLDDRRLAVDAYRTLGSITARGNELAAGRAMLERALVLAREQDDPARVAEVCGHLANACYWAGDLARSWEASVMREELARRTQDPYQLRHVYAWMALLCCDRGAWDEAERLLEHEEPIVARLDSPEPLAYLRMVRGALRHVQGRFDDAEREMSAGIEALRRGSPGTLVWYLGSLGLAQADLGRRQAALVHLAEVDSLAGALDARSVAAGGAFCRLVLAYARLGEWERAAAYYARLLPFRGAFLLVLVDRVLGVAAHCRGDRAAASRHLAAAESQARAAGMRPELALTLLHKGVIERRDGPDVARGEAAFAEGQRLCAELGMQELGRRLLDAFDLPPEPPGRRDAWPDGLSARQVEVLRLVADGRTNREIAAALSVSERTVANHMTAIFAKTGVDNRAGAAAYALRQGLA